MSEVELILTKLKIVSEEEQRGMYLCDKEHSKILLDYITNLQQENYELKYINYGDNKITIEDCVNEMNNTINELQQENERLKVNCNLGYEELKVARDYKSRCEKVIEYINKHPVNACHELLNILQN